MTLHDIRLFIRAYRTRIMGYLTALIGAIQLAAPHLSRILSPTVFDVLMVCCGVTVALIGHANARASR